MSNASREDYWLQIFLYGLQMSLHKTITSNAVDIFGESKKSQFYNEKFGISFAENKLSLHAPLRQKSRIDKLI